MGQGLWGKCQAVGLEGERDNRLGGMDQKRRKGDGAFEIDLEE